MPHSEDAPKLLEAESKLNELIQRTEQILSVFGSFQVPNAATRKLGEKIDPAFEEKQRKLVLFESYLNSKGKPLDSLITRIKKIQESLRTPLDISRFPEKKSQIIIGKALEKRVGTRMEEQLKWVQEQPVQNREELQKEFATAIALLQKEVQNQEYSRLAQALQSGKIEAFLEEQMRHQSESAEKRQTDQKDLEAGRMTFANFKKPTVIGEGAIGTVYRSSQKKEVFFREGEPAKKIAIPVALKASKNPKNEQKMAHEMKLAQQFRKTLARKGEKAPAGLALPTHLLKVEKPEDYFGFEQGTQMLVFPWIEGVSAQEFLQQKIPGRERNRAVIEIGKQLAASISKLHQEGLLHRDIKPDNLKVTSAGAPVLLDFGEMIEKTEAQKEKGQSGSLMYMPPEAYDFGNYSANEQADVYALGMTLYVLLTGKKDPFGLDSLTGSFTEKMIRAAEIKKRIHLAYNGDFSTIVLRAIENDPKKRYPTMDAFLADLEKALGKSVTSALEKKKAEEAVAREADKKQQLEGQYFGANFGSRKTTSIPEPVETPAPETEPSEEDRQKTSEEFKKRTARSKNFY